MAYIDKFTKIDYVNKDDPAFVPGASPSISAENLNAMEMGIIDGLTAADELDARLKTEEVNTDNLFNGILGVRCEVKNTSVVIQPSDWVEDPQNVRYVAVINDASITAETDVEIVLSDFDKGCYSINALDPTDGSVTLFIGSPPQKTLEVRVLIFEVRTIE